MKKIITKLQMCIPGKCQATPASSGGEGTICVNCGALSPLCCRDGKGCTETGDFQLATNSDQVCKCVLVAYIVVVS